MRRLLATSVAVLALVPASASASTGLEPFFSRHGLEIPEHTSIKMVDPDQMPRVGGRLFSDTGLHLLVDRGDHYAHEISIANDLYPIEQIEVLAHEIGHAVSTRNGSPCFAPEGQEPTNPICSEANMDQYEEGPVEYVALHLAPGLYRWATGKRFSRETIQSMRQQPGSDAKSVRLWMRAAKRTTGTNPWSRVSRNWILQVLRAPMEARPAMLAEALA